MYILSTIVKFPTPYDSWGPVMNMRRSFSRVRTYVHQRKIHPAAKDAHRENMYRYISELFSTVPRDATSHLEYTLFFKRYPVFDVLGGGVGVVLDCGGVGRNV